MKVIKKKPLRIHSKILLAVVIAGVILIPLIPLAAREAWVYTNRPEFCVSCHMMKKEYQNWFHSAHRNWAGCSGCHVPQQSIVTKLAVKMRDGLYHGYAQMFNNAHDHIRMSKHGEDTVMGKCLRCHEQLVSSIIHEGERKCWECHRGVPHGY
ncbi:MAG: NapC/NirT family cytochrome c [Thermodesulfovibrionales bacterium]|nr:NapC/NirT family cytochrome c [Thermodesulfovibrionales bacterium]